MKKIKGKHFGECVLCHVVGQGEKDFICEQCGHPEKIILTCRSCGSHMDLTDQRAEAIRRFLRTVVIELSSEGSEDVEELIYRQEFLPGTAISISSCISCPEEKETGVDLKIYSIRNHGFNVRKEEGA